MARTLLLLLVAGLGLLLYLSLVAARILGYIYTGVPGANVKTVFGNATAANDTLVMRLLLPFIGDPVEEYATRYLWTASSHGNIAAMELLLEHGADPDGLGGLYLRPLFLAASRGDRATAEILLEHGARYEVVDALFLGDEEFVRNAVEHGEVDLKSIRYRGDTLLRAAVDFQNPGAARILLEAGLSPQRCIVGKSPLEWARKRQNEELVALFESYLA